MVSGPPGKSRVAIGFLGNTGTDHPKEVITPTPFFRKKGYVNFGKGIPSSLPSCNRLHAWWSIQSRLATLLSSLIARRLVRLQTL